MDNLLFLLDFLISNPKRFLKLFLISLAVFVGFILVIAISGLLIAIFSHH